MSNITFLDDYRQHMSVRTDKGIAVFPTEMLTNYINGSLSSEEIDEFDLTIRPIIKDYLENFKGVKL